MFIKTKEEQDIIAQGGIILGKILEKIADMAKPGVSTLVIDTEAERLILEAGGRPAFKGFCAGGSIPFPGTICASINTELVHGIPKKKKILNEGDIFGIDIGMQWPVGSGLGENGDGFFTDTAVTVAVGEIPEKTKQLIKITKKALEIGIAEVKIGNSISSIGRAIQHYVEPRGYSVIRDLVGHGVGHSVHEEPRVPNYHDRELDQWIIEEGAVLALEPMVSLGDYHVITAPDGWGIITADESLNSHCEHTVIATKDGPKVVTRRPSEMV
jgi:methionyl aminopeptidase